MEQLTSGSADRVWRRWVLLSIADRLPRGESVGPVDAALEISGRLVRMRRTAGQRLVVWTSDPQRPLTRERLIDEVPDWAVGDADVEHLVGARCSFVAWHARDEWSWVPEPLSTRARGVFAAIRDDAAAAVALARLVPDSSVQAAATALARPDLDSLTTLLGPRLGRQAAQTFGELIGASPLLSSAAAQHLLDVLRAQMRQACEIGARPGSHRPRLLRQWAKVNLGQFPIRFAVYADDHGFHDANGTRGLSADQRSSLLNVLRELRAHDHPSGHWLFAQVSSEGRSIRLDRAYDHWPSWFVPAPEDRIPSFGALDREMAGRDPQWRPAWTALLPG